MGTRLRMACVKCPWFSSMSMMVLLIYRCASREIAATFCAPLWIGDRCTRRRLHRNVGTVGFDDAPA
ncbi:hypothetical protein D915_007154 [Fasciola hepatica]|uniref:Secreted protein n=1 Tax=Fasciola hepatica TaxID=6192 RepID=A0A4E0R540_FASHE|nr:hypothetical protein D915_007154 [Fasciola hepatica]